MSTLDEEYKHLHPHAFHLQLPKHHKTDGGIPYATIDAHRKARAIVKLAQGLVLKEEFFVDYNNVGALAEDKSGEDAGDDEDSDEEDGGDNGGGDVDDAPSSLHQFSIHCQRLYQQLTKLSDSHFFHSGLSQEEICQMIINVLGLLCATVEFVEDGDVKLDVEENGVSSMVLDDAEPPKQQDAKRGRKVIIHYDSVGYILNNGDDGAHTGQPKGLDEMAIEDSLSHPFALPAPARQSLLNVALELLGSKKDTLRGVSNSAIVLYDTTNAQERQRLILSHHALLRMLLRTAPYLDEHKLDDPPKEANNMRSTILKKTVNLIRSCRRFFCQGGKSLGAGAETSASPQEDATARQLWSSLRSDLQYHSHSNSCFRSLILLYLFHPSNCSGQYYSEVLPIWMECWRNVDRCPEWDFLWMVLFSRARKHLPANDASGTIRSTLRKHLLSSCKYWLQVPVGGISADKSFPNAKAPSTRSFPPRLKVFVGMGSRYEEGMDFVGRLTKLLMFCTTSCGGENDGGISEGTADILRFLSFITPYYNPSNTGPWTFPLGAFLHYLAYEVCARVGIMAGWKVLKSDHSDIAQKLLQEEPYLEGVNFSSKEIVALLDKMLPLCQQALYSKNSTVSHAGETSLLYLAQIDPSRVTPPLIDFSLRALDVSSVNLSHQAPAALSALSRLLQPALRARPGIVLSRLPDMLRLTLAGIDGNDQNKSLRTLIFYRNMVMWIPVGGSITMPSFLESSDASVLDCDGKDGTVQISTHLMESRYSFVGLEEYKEALSTLPQSSLLAQTVMEIEEDEAVLMEEAMSAMSDWSLMFLDRVYELLRAAGEQEKLGKGHGGVGARHTSADVAMTKNFSRIMKETLTYFFASMDEKTYTAALNSVARFLEEETLPFAVKDASLLCQAVCMTRFAPDGGTSHSIDRSPGLDALLPILIEDIEHKSTKCAIYRLRCLSGAVRYAGSAVLKHREAITSAIAFALSKQDADNRALFKTGCKLLRHVLSSQCEEYPIAQCFHPMRLGANGGGHSPGLGTSARLQGDKIWWHVPRGEQLDFTASLLSEFALKRWSDLGSTTLDVDDKTKVNIQQWRQTLRVLRYSLRGASGILLDEDPDTIISRVGDIFCPKEVSMAKLILSSSTETKNCVQGLRRKLCFDILDIMCLIAKDTTDCESRMVGDENEGSSRQYTKNDTGPIATDSKILKEVVEIAELVVARRGAQYNSSTGKTIYRGQKEILTDFVLASEADFLSAALSRCNDELHTGIKRSAYKDGQNAGKTVSRALLVNRIHLCSQDLTSSASTQIPRRLRKLRGPPGGEAPPSLFSLDMTMQALKEQLRGNIRGTEHTSLEAYEALVDGLSALACHPNINVRGSALSIVDFALTRFGWVVKHNHRPTRLLSAILLNDSSQGGIHGIPSCEQLVDQVNSQGKRSRLAEVVKGVIKIVALPKVLKHFHWGASNRFELVKTLCGTKKLLQLLPPEEVPKVVHYINSMFLSYRSKLCSLPRSTDKEQKTHEACLAFLLGILGDNSIVADGDKDVEPNDDAGEMHWRDRLVASWFVLKFIDEDDLMSGDPYIVAKVWGTCFTIIEQEVGQPLQRVSLGLLGRLVSLALVDMSQASTGNNGRTSPDLTALRTTFSSEKFCRAFGNALVFDHREDSSVGGGHSAQWSSGVEEIIRDSTLNIARRTLFPFNRISQKSVTFKLTHSQLIETILLAIGHENAKVTSHFLLEQAKELVASPPSEDQRNQQCTSAEIFGGVSRALIQYSTTDEERSEIWEKMLLPFLDEAVVKMPVNLVGAFFDACRYVIHHFPPSYFFPLLKWSVAKVQSSLWQIVEDNVEENNGAASSAVTDRFALQGKWLLMFQSVLAELDNEDDLGAVLSDPFYTGLLSNKPEPRNDEAVTPAELELGQSWKYVNDRLTPSLLNAIAHPYDKCRDHIASCLFRMCYCHRKFINTYKALANGNESQSNEDPGVQIMKCLSSIRDSDKYSFKEKNRALGTARKFVACCVHWGDAKHEYSEFIIPLLPLAFHSLQTTDGEVSPEDRGIEADLVKGYRYSLADISSSCVANYGINQDMTRVLGVLKEMSGHEYWQIRQACAHFLRNFQGAHKFLFTKEQEDLSLSIAISLLADDRREVSSAATSTLTGILAMLPQSSIEELVSKYVKVANKSLKKKKKKAAPAAEVLSTEEAANKAAKEKERAARQQKSVFFLCAVVLGRPYDIPPYIPGALAALSKHSFEQRASLSVREVVKMVCSEFKRTHTDNWEAHRLQFSQEQLEALEDVVSTPHYYA